MKVIARRFLRDDLGAEIVQFVLAIPILVTILWSSWEVWQVMTLRAALRTTVAQVARYVTGYATPRSGAGGANPVRRDAICQGVEELIARSLSPHRGILGDAAYWEVTWYEVTDPEASDWDLSTEPRTDCLELLSALGENDQFGVKLDLAVPWQTVVFGLKGSTFSDFVLEMSDRAVGSAPGLPYCEVRAAGATRSSGPGGCDVEIWWSFDCSYWPDKVEVFMNGDLACTVHNPVIRQENSCLVRGVPLGANDYKIVAYGAGAPTDSSTTISCP